MKIIDGHAMLTRIEGLMARKAVDLGYYNIVKEAVQMQPAIPAIPIDWLDAQIRGYASALMSTELHALLVVKRLWERDQVEPKEG